MQTSSPPSSAVLRAAAAAILNSEALLICTGAGMGVDSGLGTFRGRRSPPPPPLPKHAVHAEHLTLGGSAGVWLPLKAMGLDFSQMSTPSHFTDDPLLAWAFWRYRHIAYTKGEPHLGYALLADWGRSKPLGLFSVTSNIDGHWQRTPGVGLDRLFEVHGTLTRLQTVAHGTNIWPTPSADIDRMAAPDWDLMPGEQVVLMQTF
jgi:NAD-dependent SIR2 family protein deacetylase